MLRTIFTIGIFALLGLIALRLVFGVFIGLVGAFGFLLGLALKIAFVGLIVYVVILLVSPNTARKIREKW
jgi:hypothetical protein